VRAVAIGALAHAALDRTNGRARVLVRLSASAYLTAGDALVWLGGVGATLHPRAILVAGTPAPERASVYVDAIGLRPWRPEVPTLDARALDRLREGWRRLAAEAEAGALGPPGGLGALVTGQALTFPLEQAETPARALARACARDDTAAALHAAGPLLGLGGGLTPSGDDYVGGALFARHVLAAAGEADASAWCRAADAVLATAHGRTHPISIALLGDLAAGLGWAPLHDLVGALAGGAGDAAIEAARRLTRLGHTSGWDLLAGFGAGLGTLTGTAPA
jgi:hypothetical protein